MARRSKRLVYLLGFMGCGKSTVGKLLAHEAGWPFIDLDTTIEGGQGLSIRQIFENSGEPFFREIEHAALVEASKTEPAVIALGGGTWVQPFNMDLIRRTGGATIWLDCGVEELQHRCEALTNRPLFDSPESFVRLFHQRLPYYRLAEFRVATDGSAPEEVVERILRLSIF